MLLLKFLHVAWLWFAVLFVVVLDLNSTLAFADAETQEAHATTTATSATSAATASATATSASSSQTEPTKTKTKTVTKTVTTTAIYDMDWELIETYKHDRASFTQGLEVHPSSVILNPNGNNSCDASSSSSLSSSSSSSSLLSCSSDDDAEERLLVTESTGMHGNSLLRIWDPATGIVHKETQMDPRFFGEGMTHYVDDRGNNAGGSGGGDNTTTTTSTTTTATPNQTKIAVLTYQEGSILIFDAHTLQLLDTIERWPSPTTTGEGWGIAFDPLRKIFVVTDGSEYLHFWNLDFEEIPPPLSLSSSDTGTGAGAGGVPNTTRNNKLAVRIEELVVPSPDGSGTAAHVLIPRRENSVVENERTHGIALPGNIIGHLNELEWDASTGTLLANKWIEEVVVRIDPTTGLVIRVYDFSRLYPRDDRVRPPEGYSREDVFNGIAVLPNTDGKEWLLTGKYWPYMYRIRIKE